MMTRIIAAILLVMGLVSTIEAQLPYGPTLSWNSDGSRIAIVVNNNVEVMDTVTHRVLQTLKGHTDFVYMVAWSPDDHMIATSSDDQTIKVWDVADGTLLYTFTGHDDSVTNVWWSTDGSKILSSGFYNGKLFVWDVGSESLLLTYDRGSIVDGAFSADRHRFAVSNSLSIYILDGSTFEVIASSPRVACCANQMYSIVWSPDGNIIATGSLNGLVTLWDTSTPEIKTIKQFTANSHYASDSRDVDNLSLSWVRDVKFSPDGRMILAISGDGTLREWDIKTEKLIQDLQIGSLYTAAWSPFGGRLAIMGASAENAQPSNIPGLQFVVPAPSFDLIESIESACVPADVIAQLPDAETDIDAYIAAVEKNDAIAPACAADLMAVAGAMRAEGIK